MRSLFVRAKNGTHEEIFLACTFLDSLLRHVSMVCLHETDIHIANSVAVLNEIDDELLAGLSLLNRIIQHLNNSSKH